MLSNQIPSLRVDSVRELVHRYRVKDADSLTRGVSIQQLPSAFWSPFD